MPQDVLGIICEIYIIKEKKWLCLSTPILSSVLSLFFFSSSPILCFFLCYFSDLILKTQFTCTSPENIWFLKNHWMQSTTKFQSKIASVALRSGQVCSFVAFLLKRKTRGSSYCVKETSLLSRRTNGSSFCLRFQERFHWAMAVSSFCCLLSEQRALLRLSILLHVNPLWLVWKRSLGGREWVLVLVTPPETFRINAIGEIKQQSNIYIFLQLVEKRSRKN